MSSTQRHYNIGVRRTRFIVFASALLLVFLLVLLFKKDGERVSGKARLVLFCAAGMRLPMERIAQDYERECGVHIEAQYGGSNTLLSQLQVSKAADLYLAADRSYLELAQEKGLITAINPIADMVPVIVVGKGNPHGIRAVSDLLDSGMRIALGNPDQAAIGKKTREALVRSGQWDAMKQEVMRSGVFKPTVPDVANTVLVGSVDAGIVWSATASQYPDLESVFVPELSAGRGRIAIGVTALSTQKEDALRFMRYVTSANRGLKIFGEMGYESVEGPLWTSGMDTPPPNEKGEGNS